MPRTFAIISLGCAKNTVDSRSMAELLQRDGYSEVQSPVAADTIIVNTCGFILPAKQESLQVLKKLAGQKRKSQRLVAAGCLTEREKEQVAKAVPGVDALIGTRRWMDIPQVIKKLETQPNKFVCHLPAVPTVGQDDNGVLRAAVQGASAYLEIADGCNRKCAYCAIPLIKGPMVSRPMDRILQEVRQLEQMGIKELVLIAQDTTAYGRDLGMRDGLAVLLEEIVQAAPLIPWIRILYTFPGEVSDALIKSMAAHRQILPYLDMPLQHAHPDVLRRMRRPADMQWVRGTIAKMRTAMPELVLRTTFIVGFPGETEDEFKTLLDFVQEMQFDRLGIFQYFHEEGTCAYALADDVAQALKEERLARLAQLQAGISLQRNQQFIGQDLEVLIEGVNQGVSMGRSYRDAPEIDGLVILEEELEVGELIKVRITDALVHDLFGERKT
ncbi:MAG TPA: 30S ribosomal protein S12 methylthiotransferase RimO [Anaerolineae bacterium]|nr:30S ribosomal protein S12 methylthiotransferase RimO [Anaerolineae bacterium]